MTAYSDISVNSVLYYNISSPFRSSQRWQHWLVLQPGHQVLLCLRAEGHWTLRFHPAIQSDHPHCHRDVAGSEAPHGVCPWSSLLICSTPSLDPDVCHLTLMLTNKYMNTVFVFECFLLFPYINTLYRGRNLCGSLTYLFETEIDKEIKKLGFNWGVALLNDLNYNKSDLLKTYSNSKSFLWLFYSILFQI